MDNLWPLVSNSCVLENSMNSVVIECGFLLQDFRKVPMQTGILPGCEPCHKKVCAHGTCQPSSQAGFTCECEEGWTGPLCDQRTNDPCLGNKCTNIILSSIPRSAKGKQRRYRSSSEKIPARWCPKTKFLVSQIQSYSLVLLAFVIYSEKDRREH